jgi:hypothetical protein
MLHQFKSPPVIHGRTVPGRRYTGWAALYFAGFVAFPVLALTLALDLLGWFVATRLFDASCYGLLCLFG